MQSDIECSRRFDLKRGECGFKRGCIYSEEVASARDFRIRRFGDQRTVDFPQIAQYFVAEGEGREIERRLGENLLAKTKVSGRCNAVLVGLEPR